MPRTADAALAPAKVNLTLRVTGRRADGRHELDSLVVFAGVGDVLSVRPAGEYVLEVDGPFAAGVPTGPENIVMRAARALRPQGGGYVRLTKNLPHGGGIGGGTSDAAAALRLLGRQWGTAVPGRDALMALGADLPVCMHAPAPAWMTGCGERVARVPDLPDAWLVLAAPRAGASTAEVFAAHAALGVPFEDFAGPPPAALEVADLALWAVSVGNDLAVAAATVVPEIAEVLAALRAAPGVLGAGMSGSGSTCWGLCGTEGAARAAAGAVAAADRWCVAAPMLRPGDSLAAA